MNLGNGYMLVFEMCEIFHIFNTVPFFDRVHLRTRKVLLPV